jgi:hypothetical protein
VRPCFSRSSITWRAMPYAWSKTARASRTSAVLAFSELLQVVAQGANRGSFSATPSMSFSAIARQPPLKPGGVTYGLTDVDQGSLYWIR